MFKKLEHLLREDRHDDAVVVAMIILHQISFDESQSFESSHCTLQHVVARNQEATIAVVNTTTALRGPDVSVKDLKCINYLKDNSERPDESKAVKLKRKAQRYKERHGITILN